MSKPLISCITPTANRQKYLPFAIKYFLEQDYAESELIIIDDGLNSCIDLIPDNSKIKYFYYDQKIGTIGTKRNIACEKSLGEIIVHWDDDDWYAKDWVSRHVEAHKSSGADITGLNKVDFYSPATNRRWRYEDTDTDRPWLCGATMAYRKSLWEKHPFIDLQVGEDYDFVWNSGGTTFAMDYLAGFVSLLHAHNTSLKPIENPKHKKHAEAWTEGKNAFSEEDH